MFPLGRSSRATRPLATGSSTFTKTIGIVRVSRWTSGRRGRACHNDVGLRADQLLGERSYPINVIAEPAKVHPHVAAIGPTEIRKRLSERRDASLPQGIVFVVPHEHADAPHAVALLRPCRERPRRRAAKERDEFAPSKANPHLALPCEGTYRGRIARPERPVLTVEDEGDAGLRLGLISGLGHKHKPAYLSPRRAGGMSAMPAIVSDFCIAAKEVRCH